jgi:hypothetical protein
VERYTYPEYEAATRLLLFALVVTPTQLVTGKDVLLHVRPESLERKTPASVEVAARSVLSLLESIELQVTLRRIGFATPASVKLQSEPDALMHSNPSLARVSKTILAALVATRTGAEKETVNE